MQCCTHFVPHAMNKQIRDTHRPFASIQTLMLHAGAFELNDYAWHFLPCKKCKPAWKRH